MGADLATGIGTSFMRELCGDRWRSKEIPFSLAAREGLSFQSLLDEACRATAYELLANSDMRAVNAATALGYSDPAAFTRAFRRWTGTTPSAWRARGRAQQAGRELTRTDIK